jgi:hypothetical protein
MIRILTLISVIGFIVAVVCLGGAAALGGNAIRHGWSFPASWHVHVRDHHHWNFDDDDDADMPRASRTLAWSGANRIEIDVPADVHYTQGPGPAHITVSGPDDAVAHVVADGERIRSDRSIDTRSLRIDITAPSVQIFQLNGSGRLKIEDYDQDRLEINSSGSARIRAEGHARDVHINLSGSGDADLGAIAAQTANVDISGSADATIAPTQSAEVHISGSGDVTVTSRPARMVSDVSGSGRVIQGESSDDSDRPPAVNAAPASPMVPATPATPRAPATNAAPAH